MLGIGWFSQPIVGLGEPIDDRLHNQLKNFCRWTVGQGSDIGNHSIRDMDRNLSTIDVVLYRRRCDICANDFLF